jgi:hypothetical protein
MYYTLKNLKIYSFKEILNKNIKIILREFEVVFDGITT